MDNTTDKPCVILDKLPPAAFCGIDLVSFTISDRFRGVKLLPRGWHVVFAGTDDAFSLRHGVWFEVKPLSDGPHEVFVINWNGSSYALEPEEDQVKILGWRANLGAIWREGLTPYRQTARDTAEGDDRLVEEKQDWTTLTDCISEPLLERITGPACGFAKNQWTLTSASSTELDDEVIRGPNDEIIELETEKVLGLLPIDLKRTWREGAVGRERTLAARDRSWALEHLQREHCKTEFEVIGEFQFCFLMVLTLNNNSCLLQWERILTLVLTCKSAALEQPEFFGRFLTTLKLQLEHCEDGASGLLDIQGEHGTILKSLLGKFRAEIEQQPVSEFSDLIDDLADLEGFLNDTYGWQMNEDYVRRGTFQLEDGEEVQLDMNEADEEEELGEYAPTVVDLTPEQIEALPRDQADSS